MTFYSDDEIRSALARRIRHEPIQEIWDCLVDDDHVREVREGTAEIDDLAKEYRRLRRKWGHLLKQSKGDTDVGPRQSRLQVLSKMIAEQAATEKGVIGFRKQHLAEGLLKREEIGEWITKQAAEDGPVSHYMRFPIPGDYDLTRRNEHFILEPPLTISNTLPGTRLEVELLSYASHDAQWVERIPVKHGGTLDNLRQLSKFLARQCAWQETQATTFVLAGTIPLLSSLRGGFLIRIGQPISSRITMDIDPTLTPEEVAEQYKKIRAGLIVTRYRSMTEKHLRLAEFYGGTKPKGMTWVALMDEWNHSQEVRWSYDRYESFARDCKQAWHRLMGGNLTRLPDL